MQALTGQDRQVPDADALPAESASPDDVLFARPLLGVLSRIVGRGRIDWGAGPEALISIGVTWVPLLVLSLLQGGVAVFAADIAVHARFLLALPLLLAADAATAPRLDAIVRHFLDAGFVRDEDRGRYAEAVAETKAWLDSRLSAIAAGLIAYAVVFASLLSISLDRLAGWHVSGMGYSAAGWWHALVSLPFLIAVLVDWVWRIFMWALFLRRMSRLDLQLVAAHPDKVGGLAFVGYSLRACSLLALAIATMIAGGAANHALHENNPFFAPAVLASVSLSVSLLLFASPPLAFVQMLSHEWRRGVFEYGELASRFGQSFEGKWLGHRQFERDHDIASPDFSAATDLYQVASNVYEMRFVPVDLASLILLVGAALAPFVPVLLLSVPFAEVTDVLKNLLL